MKVLIPFKGFLVALLVTASCQVLATSQNETLVSNSQKPKSSSKDNRLTSKDISAKDQQLQNIKNDSIIGGTGVDGGGGNRLGSRHPMPNEISNWVQSSKVPARFVLKRLEFFIVRSSAEDSPTLPVLRQKLFDGKVTVYEALERAQLHSNETGPCNDRYGTTVDGSAKDSPDICISAFRLSQSLTEDSGQQEVLALVIHEISHMVGTTEDEAKMLQYMAKSSLSKQPITDIPKAAEAFKSTMKDALDSLSSLNDSLPYMTTTEICLGLGGVQQQLMAIQGNVYSLGEDKGFYLFRPQELSIPSGLSLKAMNAITFCFRPSIDYQHQFDSAFSGRSETTLSELQSKLYPNNKDMVSAPNWIVYRVRSGDKNALAIEVKDLTSKLKNILKTY